MHHRTPRPLRRPPACVALLLTALAGACACPPREPAAPGHVLRAEVEALLGAQVAAWNVGDLDGFMATYWRSPALTFVGSAGLTRGHAETLARYRAAYPDPDTRGTLRFELLEVRPLGSGGALLAIGRWHLERAAPVSGTFSLVLERRPDGLRIVHDHSSADA